MKTPRMAANAIARMRNAAPVYSIEVVNRSVNGFRHRIKCNDGRVGVWAGYTSISVLDDHCTATPYFIGGNDAKVLTAVDFITKMDGRRL